MLKLNPLDRKNGVSKTDRLPTLFDYFANLLWMCYLAFSPVYVFTSGVPQPADYLVPILIAMLFLSRKLKIDKTVLPCYQASRDFFSITAVVAIGWTFFTITDPRTDFAIAAKEYLLPVVMYFFNILAVGAFCVLVTRHRDLAIKFTLFGTTLAIVLQFTAINFLGRISSGGTREAGTFNNPNQLAYFSILYGVIAVALSRYFIERKDPQTRTIRKIIKFFPFAILPLVVYLSYVSMSRSGLIAAILLVVTSQLKSAKTIIAFIAFSVLASILIGDVAVEKVEKNLNRRRNQDFVENAVGRYHRLVDDPEYMIIGAGEGNKHRFTLAGGHEVHSTLGTVVFSYGLFGLFLFLRIYYRVFQAGGLWYLLMCAPPIVYGFSHNGLRQTAVWLVPVIFYFIARAIVTEKASAKPAMGPRCNTPLIRSF